MDIQTVPSRATATAPRLRLPTEEEVRRSVGGAVFLRGEAYCRQGAVLSLARRGASLLAEVAGSRAEPYIVTLSTRRDGRLRAECTCPFMAEGDDWCKHVVAALLHALRTPDAVGEEPAIDALLAPLSAEQLRALVAEWAGDDPDAYDRVRAFAARCSEPQGGPASVDAVRAAVRRRVRRALHSLEGMRGSEAYWHVGDVAAQVERVIEEADDSLARGECAAALATLEGVTVELVDGWTGLDDSDGEMSALFWPLARAWAAAVLTAPLTAEGRGELAKCLDEWHAELEPYGVDSLGLAVAAAEEGWDEPRVARALAGEAAASPDPSNGSGSSEDVEDSGDEDDAAADEWSADLMDVRLDVLERAGRLDDALRLARAAGMHARAADLLLTMGRAGEALSLALEHLPGGAESRAVAQRLWEMGERERALELGERALAESGGAALAAWLRDRADEAGRPDLALRAAEAACRAAPSADAWRELQRLAGGGWPALRGELLAWLPSSAVRGAAGAVDVYLLEERWDDALDAVEEGGTYELAGRVADACAEHVPERVIPLARRHAERIMDAGKSDAYGAAAAWLRRARRAHAAAGRADEWNAYLSRLLARHRQKHKLRPILEALGRLG